MKATCQWTAKVTIVEYRIVSNNMLHSLLVGRPLKVTAVDPRQFLVEGHPYTALCAVLLIE